MMPKKGGEPSAVEGSNWPENPGRKCPQGPQDYAEAERYHRAKYDHALWEYREGYREHPPFYMKEGVKIEGYCPLPIPPEKPPRERKVLLTDEERDKRAIDRLAEKPGGEFVPRIWGMGEHATDARERGAERVHVAGMSRRSRKGCTYMVGGGVQTVYPSSDEGANRGPPKVTIAIHPEAEKKFVPWMPTPEHPEDRWGATSKAISATFSPDVKIKNVKAPDDGRMNAVSDPTPYGGLRLAMRLYRENPIVGSVAVEKLEKRAKASKIEGVTAKDLASMSVKATVSMSDIAALHVRRGMLPRASAWAVDRPRAAPACDPVRARAILAF